MKLHQSVAKIDAPAREGDGSDRNATENGRRVRRGRRVLRPALGGYLIPARRSFQIW